MHAKSPPLTIGRTVLTESDCLYLEWHLILRWHLRSTVSSAASQKIGILRKSCWVFHDRSLLGRCFRGFVLPVLEYCSAVWCSPADTHVKLLDRCSQWCPFLTGGVFECDIAHRRSVAVMCMLYKIRCNPMHPLMVLYLDRMCQCGLHAVLWLHICILIRRLAAEPRSTAGLFIPLSVSLWNDLADPVLDSARLPDFKSRATAFLLS